MARYTCNYIPPSVGTAYTGIFVGSFQCSSNSTSGCFACIPSSTYRADNFVTVLCCSNWCYTSGTTCFLQNMACFDEVNFSAGFCMCTSGTDCFCLFLLNCRCAIHCHSTTPVFRSFGGSSLGPAGAINFCTNFLYSQSVCRGSFSISFFPFYDTCAICTGVPSIVGYRVDQVNIACTSYAAVMRIGCVFPCADTPAAGWLDWSTFNGFSLTTGNLTSGTGCYSIRARIRCS